MKHAIIVHGWGGCPREGWQSWLKKQLEKKGWKVETPKMPNTDEPKIHEWVSKLQEFIEGANRETYLIGHSIGCQAILRLLETLEEETKVGGCIFVAGWFNLLETAYREEEEKEIAKPWLETKINLKKVKEHCDKFICIFSDNDSCVPLSDKEIFKEKLNAEIIIEKEKGHFTGEENINKLPVVLEKLEEISK